MEFLMILVVVIVMLVLLGVSLLSIVAGIWWLLTLLGILCVVFFLLSMVLVLVAKKREATFLRIEKGKLAGAFAVYEIEGTEYRNLFPTDVFLREVLYRRKQVFVRMLQLGRKRLVFDRVTLVIVSIGLPAFTILTLIMTGFLQ